MILSRRVCWLCYHLPSLLFSAFLLLNALLAVVQAQITLDGSLEPRGPLQGPNYEIPDEVGQLRGSNLFHSFGAFNVQTGESATFTGPRSVSNILGRVTGGNPLPFYYFILCRQQERGMDELHRHLSGGHPHMLLGLVDDAHAS